MAQCKCHAAAFNKEMFRLLDCAVQCEFCAPPSQSGFNLTPPPFPNTNRTSSRVTNILHIQSDLAAAPAGGAFSPSFLTSTWPRAAGLLGRPRAPRGGNRTRTDLLSGRFFFTPTLESREEIPIGKGILKAPSWGAGPPVLGRGAPVKEYFNSFSSALPNLKNLTN